MAAAFLAGAFLAGAFFAGALVAAFAGAFLAGAFLAGALVAAFAGAFLAGAALVAVVFEGVSAVACVTGAAFVAATYALSWLLLRRAWACKIENLAVCLMFVAAGEHLRGPACGYLSAIVTTRVQNL
ncbi:Uncharacterised protein [Mycobacteroides abscessus subsp. abscessus]|nr:Uncharacterised protein [Mycobacteroides abscessus subsp. abscessus]SKS30781.1 Uncharacterised protein [Mycobacteroides abscessus subsp. massiliense]SKS87927.1 Uncharacterised protein [Mycobacteroides abscessus subsp. massiliense]SKT04416.1 Uncharacterised protein [Mycobacteroides abscessus subsp. massiliense]SKX00691.1 Uncharacterised protein [Mycobacteroides abscessus subsp. massiliense]